MGNPAPGVAMSQNGVGSKRNNMMQCLSFLPVQCCVPGFLFLFSAACLPVCLRYAAGKERRDRESKLPCPWWGHDGAEREGRVMPEGTPCVPALF